jgi:hypothetical protein
LGRAGALRAPAYPLIFVEPDDQEAVTVLRLIGVHAEVSLEDHGEAGKLLLALYSSASRPWIELRYPFMRDSNSVNFGSSANHHDSGSS